MPRWALLEGSLLRITADGRVRASRNDRGLTLHLSLE